MQNTGLLRAIRELVVEGRSSREIINLGYAPGSVYKAQRQVRQRWPGRQLTTEGQAEQAEIAYLRTENNVFRQEAMALRGEVSQLREILKETQQRLLRANEKAMDLGLDRRKLQARITDLQQKVGQLQQEISELSPLGVWAGHPCGVCSKPLRGIVDRQTGAKLLKNLAHEDCKREQPAAGLPFTLWGPPLIPAR